MESVLEKGSTEKLNILCPTGYTFVNVRIKEKVARASVLLPCACNSYLSINITLEGIRISTSNVSSCTGRQPAPPHPTPYPSPARSCLLTCVIIKAKELYKASQLCLCLCHCLPIPLLTAMNLLFTATYGQLPTTISTATLNLPIFGEY